MTARYNLLISCWDLAFCVLRQLRSPHYRATSAFWRFGLTEKNNDQLGIVMDPIANINIKKDSSFLCCWKHSVVVTNFTIWRWAIVSDQWRSPRPYPHAEREAEHEEWFSFVGEQDLPLADLDVS